jgi:site-specific recombinase XerD
MKHPIPLVPAVSPTPTLSATESHIATFAESLAAQGYSDGTIERKISLLRKFDQWLLRRRIAQETVDDTRADQFFRYRRSRGHVRSSELSTLQSFLKHLREAEVIPHLARRCDHNPLQQLESEFTQYLLEKRGLACATIEQYLIETRRFLSSRFGTGPIHFQELHVQDVTEFIVGRASIVSASAAKHAVTALRTLFRFLRQRGDIATNLMASVPTVPNWSLAGLPKYLSSNDVEHVLQTAKGDNVEQRRDRAILLLLARLGLRAGEVAQLTLDDIDWDSGELIIRGKGGRLDRLPIPVDVGRALVAYLRYNRPHCSSRHVFIRLRAPHQGFTGSDAIGRVARVALNRAGLNPPIKGAHVLRHSLATRLLQNGVSLTGIGQVLRHELPKTTAIYAKVDIAALRALAQPWPGGKA